MEMLYREKLDLSLWENHSMLFQQWIAQVGAGLPTEEASPPPQVESPERESRACDWSAPTGTKKRTGHNLPAAPSPNSTNTCQMAKTVYGAAGPPGYSLPVEGLEGPAADSLRRDSLLPADRQRGWQSSASRAVGMANQSNPVAIIVPATESFQPTGRWEAMPGSETKVPTVADGKGGGAGGLPRNGSSHLGA